MIVAIAACLNNPVVAQNALEPLAALLPGSTVAAVHLGHLDGDDLLREFWREVIAGADYGAIAPTVERLVNLFGAGLPHRTGAVTGGHHDLLSQFRGDLTAECPQLANSLEALESASGGKDAPYSSSEMSLGSAVIGVTLSRHNPLPGAVAIVRPGDAEGWGDVYQALVYCYASDVAINQDGVALSVFADGSDQPLVGATVNGDFIFATTVDLTRASVRLANGANEANHVRSPIGLVAKEMMGQGISVTLDLGALATGLQGLTGMIPGNDASVLASKMLATLRTVRGMAANVRIDAAGLLFNSVVVVDDRYGESEFAELLVPKGQPLAAPKLVPAGAASLAVGRVALIDTVAWIDSWLSAAAPLLTDESDVRSLARSHLGLDLDSALLSWLGNTWQAATLEVPSTDLVPYLFGQKGVLAVPVTSDAAARVGLNELANFAEGALGRLGDTFGATTVSGDLGSSDLGASRVGWSDLVAVTDVTYRGLDYERWRVGPLADFGVAVIDSQLVIATPAATMSAVIDVYLGADSVLTDSRLGGLVPLPELGLVSYELVDAPRYLTGLADLTDLVVAPAATGLRAAAREALASGKLTDVSTEDLPTFAELVGLGDFVTDLLRVLAGKTGVVMGSREVVGSALWSTYRLPLR